MTAHITRWPDASSQSLDGTLGTGQTAPNFQASSGSPGGVYPRVVCTGSAGVIGARLPTNDSFTLYVVGTFLDGALVNGIAGPGGFTLDVTGGGKVTASVWPTAFDLNAIKSTSAVVSGTGAQILRLTFDRQLGRFKFHVDGSKVSAVVTATGDPTDSGLSENTCTPQLLTSGFEPRVGRFDGSNPGGSYVNRVLMYDMPHPDASALIVETALRTQWGL